MALTYEEILRHPTTPAYPIGYNFWIHNHKDIEAAAIRRYQEAHGRAPAPSDVAHGLWRGLNEGDRWRTLENAWNETWPILGGPTPPPTTQPKRTGPVRLDRSAFVDDQGPWNALGTSLFWALWGEKHDPARLEQNLAWLAAREVDYIRILGMVGGPSWADRTIDPHASDYWSTVDALMRRLNRHGMRAQVTVFAAADYVMTDHNKRRAFATAWADYATAHAASILYLETANEYWQNGFGVEDLRELTRLMRERTSVLVAASSPTMSYPEVSETEEQRAAIDEWMAIYGSGAADLMTMHFDRDISKSEGPWRPVRQPWEMQFGAFNTGVHAYVNSEPIGPRSSVADDDDPERLVMSAVVTWLAKGAGYTLHTGAGVRGGGQADLDRGRAANVWDVPNLDTTLRAIGRMRALLPVLPNGSPKNSHWGDAPFNLSDRDAVVRAYQTVLTDTTFVGTLIGVASPVTFTSKRPAMVKAYKWDGTPISESGPFTESVIVLGQWQ